MYIWIRKNYLQKPYANNIYYIHNKVFYGYEIWHKVLQMCLM